VKEQIDDLCNGEMKSLEQNDDETSGSNENRNIQSTGVHQTINLDRNFEEREFQVQV